MVRTSPLVRFVVAIVPLAVALFALGGVPVAPASAASGGCENVSAANSVLYYTDRQKAGDAQLFNGERGLGARRTSVVATGAVSAPATRENLRPCASQAAFYAALKKRFVAAAGRQVLIYVHGYYTPFVAAANDALAIQKRLQFRGPVVVYSWPSKVTSRLAYVNDESNADWSLVDFRTLLATIEKKDPGTTVSFVTHSLGGRFATAGMSLLRHLGCTKTCFGRALLFAPDVDSGTMLAELHSLALCNAPPKPNPKAAAKVTIYVSNRDVALRQSQRLHGHQRAGQAGSEMLLCGGVDTIDVGYRKFSDSAQHSYQTDARVLGDAASAFAGISPADPRRKLTAVTRDGGTYYELR